MMLTVTLVLFAGLATCAKLVGGAPPIHDISTDTNDPPLFVDVLPLRENAKNPVVYEGSRVAMLQHSAYPDIAPVDLPIVPAEAFVKALAAATAMGWVIVAADAPGGRIEATATTRVFRFKDDVVVRIRARANGSRVDVRSVSRIGVGDLGKNASRVREFISRLRA